MSGIDPAGLVAETLIDRATLQARIAELGAQITRDYADDPPLLVCVLKGAFVFVADLVRAIDLPVQSTSWRSRPTAPARRRRGSCGS